jgi:hypothetical protein
MRSLVLVLGLVGAAAWGQAQRPSVVPAPLELQANPALKKLEDQLKSTFASALRERGGVLTPMKAEAEAAYAAGKRQDCRESNECLMQLAARAGTLYALFAEVGYSEKKVISVSARVVRDDGKVMGSTVVSEDKGKDTIVEVSKRLFLKAFEELALPNLPTFKEAKADPPTPELTKIDPPLVVKELPPPPPPPPPQVTERVTSPGRIAGLVLVGAGALAAIGGVVAIAAVPDVVNDQGNVTDVDAFRRVQGQQAAGVGLLVGGGAVAIAGAVIAIVSKDREVTKTALVPTPGGAVLVVGGSF